MVLSPSLTLTYNSLRDVHNIMAYLINNPKEVNPNKFLDTKLNLNDAYKFSVYRKNTKLFSPWTSKTPQRYSEIQSMVIFIVQKEYHQTLTKKPF